MKKPERTAVTVRMAPQLLKKLDSEAKRAERSLGAEIRLRLQQSLAKERGAVESAAPAAA